MIVSDKGFHRPDFSLAIKSVNNDISKLSTKKSHTNPVHLIMTIIISRTINLTHVNSIKWQRKITQILIPVKVNLWTDNEA